jgi:hypothetical protein
MANRTNRPEVNQVVRHIGCRDSWVVFRIVFTLCLQIYIFRPIVEKREAKGTLNAAAQMIVSTFNCSPESDIKPYPYRYSIPPPRQLQHWVETMPPDTHFREWCGDNYQKARARERST